MQNKRKFAGMGTIVVLLFVSTVYQLQAQSPTPTPSPSASLPTATSVPAIGTPSPPTETPTVTQLNPSRQAVVKRSVDGDSIEVVFVDGGQVATIHLANVNAPESIETTECFGREAAEYAVLAYQNSPLISIELAGEVKDGEGYGYVYLADGTFLNLVIVLFGYARYDGTIQTVHSEKIREAESQSKQGRTGLWRACGETEKPPKPCFLFNRDEVDSASKREALSQMETASEIDFAFRYAYYDPVQNEVIVTWKLVVDDMWSELWLDEYYRLPECLRDRSVMYEN